MWCNDWKLILFKLSGMYVPENLLSVIYQLSELWHQRLTPNQQKSLNNSVGIMTTLMPVWRHLLVETCVVWKPVHWLAMPARGPVCTCCDFSCWMIFSNGLSGQGLWRFFGFIVIFNNKSVLDLGVARTQRGFWILGCFWDAVIISILK